MAKIMIETYGCTLNQADSEIMGSLLEHEGHVVTQGKASDDAAYDYLIVNTCTVKAPTERKILERIGKASELGERLIIAGCMASANRDLVERFAPMASIVSTNNIGKIADMLPRIAAGQRAVFTDYFHQDKLLSCPYPSGKTVIAKIPISEGCVGCCSFCETRFARGPLNSFSEKMIIETVKANVSSGAKEVDLTSQDAGAYGLDSKTDIASLVDKVSDIPGEFMIRVGMLNPEHLHRYFDRLVGAYQSGKVYKFIHLPVQSGSDSVLRDMGRRYSIEEASYYMRELRKHVKGISIETDMMVGYPTETDEDFEDSLNWLRSARPTVTNVSKFSVRPHAPAARLKQIRSEEIKHRSLEMVSLVRKIQEEDMKLLVGKEGSLLITGRNSRSFEGRDLGYHAIAVHGIGLGVGKFVNARITGSCFAYLSADA